MPKFTELATMSYETLRRRLLRDLNVDAIDFLPFTTARAVGVTTAGTIELATIPRVLTMTKFEIAVAVNVTNDATNHWQLVIQSSITAQNILGTQLDTSQIPVGTWVKLSLDMNIALDPAPASIWIVANKVNAPGALSWAGPIVRYT